MHRKRVARAVGALAFSAAVLAGSALPSAAQKSGGTLRIYNSSNPPSASLHEETTIASVMSFSGVYNNLVRFDPTKVRNSVDNIQPELATSWSWDDTRTKLTFKLRNDVRWHDGKPFTAKDVQCTFHRLNGNEKDYLRRNPRGIWYEHLAEVTTSGDHEATLVLRQPQTSLLSMLAAGYTAIYPCHVAGRDMRTKPIGTGPFKFAEFKSNELIRLERNKDYWKKGLPYLDAVEWRIVPNRSTRILAFQAGEFDMTQILDITAPLLIEMQEKAPKAVCSMVPSNVSTHMLVNRDAPPFDNPELRMAMMLALDRQAFIDILSLGKARLAGAMMAQPEGAWGMPPEELRKLPSYGDPAAQRDRAIKIMEKLGYGPGNRLKVKVATRDFNTFKDPAVILVDQLNRIHFDATLDIIESSLWYNRLFGKQYQVALNLAGAGIDDPDGVLKMGFSSRSDANFSQYKNPEVDKLLAIANEQSDPKARAEALEQVFKIANDDVVLVPIFWPSSAMAINKKYKLTGYTAFWYNVPWAIRGFGLR